MTLDKLNVGYFCYKKTDEEKKKFYENVLAKCHHNQKTKVVDSPMEQPDMTIIQYESDSTEDFYKMMRDVTPDTKETIDPKYAETVGKIKGFLEEMFAKPGGDVNLSFDPYNHLNLVTAMREIEKMPCIKKCTSI